MVVVGGGAQEALLFVRIRMREQGLALRDLC